MKHIIEFILFFLLVFLYYYIFATKRFKAKYNTKTSVNLPEAKLFITLNKIDIKKINYKFLMKQITFIFSTVLSLTVLSLEISNNILLKILIGLVVLLSLTVLAYKLLSLYYKKKGMINNV